MQTIEATLGEVIGGIGERGFAPRAARALCGFSGFDLAAIVLHRRQNPSAILFDDFDRVGCRSGIETYVRATYRINPMLGESARGVVRAKDYRRRVALAGTLLEHLVEAPEEELGYRTVGWPARHEEVGLYFEGWGGLIEFGLYRERARTSASTELLDRLGALGRPIAAAFERHHALANGREPIAGALTARERDVYDLLLRGCSSEAIALRLAISRHTVKDHRKSIFRKLRIGSLAELFAQRH